MRTCIFDTQCGRRPARWTLLNLTSAIHASSYNKVCNYGFGEKAPTVELGLKITWDNAAGWRKISQTDYVTLVLCRFGVSDCNPLATSGYGPERLWTTQPLDTALDDKGMQEYQRSAWSLTSLAQWTRYDILFAIIELARATSRPPVVHFMAEKHLK